MRSLFSKLKTKEQDLKSTQEGFTLVELLVVVSIIGLLALVAIPTFLNQRKKAQDASAKSSLKNTLENWNASQAGGELTSDSDSTATAAKLNDNEKAYTYIADTPSTNPNIISVATDDLNPPTPGPGVIFGALSDSGTRYCVTMPRDRKGSPEWYSGTDPGDTCLTATTLGTRIPAPGENGDPGGGGGGDNFSFSYDQDNNQLVFTGAHNNIYCAIWDGANNHYIGDWVSSNWAWSDSISSPYPFDEAPGDYSADCITSDLSRSEIEDLFAADINNWGNPWPPEISTAFSNFTITGGGGPSGGGPTGPTGLDDPLTGCFEPANLASLQEVAPRIGRIMQFFDANVPNDSNDWIQAPEGIADELEAYMQAEYPEIQINPYGDTAWNDTFWGAGNEIHYWRHADPGPADIDEGWANAVMYIADRSDNINSNNGGSWLHNRSGVIIVQVKIDGVIYALQHLTEYGYSTPEGEMSPIEQISEYHVDQSWSGMDDAFDTHPDVHVSDTYSRYLFIFGNGFDFPGGENCSYEPPPPIDS